MNELNQNYYTTVPVSVLYDSRLTDGELRMLMLIVNLVHRYGYCCAENSYLAKISGKEPRTITRVLTALEEKGYIRREMLREERTGKVTERRIYVEFMQPLESEPDSHPEPGSHPEPDSGQAQKPEETDKNVGTPLTKMSVPPDRNVGTPPDKNVGVYKENNIYIHTSEQNQASQPACSSGRCPVSEQSPDAHAPQIKTKTPEPETQTQPEKKPKRERPHYERESDEYRLAAYLYNWKLQFNPNMKQPDLQQWAHQFHHLLHSKRRAKPVTVEEIKWRIEFSQKNGFWRKNIQSAAKLCEQYDRLYDEMSSLEQQGYLRIDDRKNVVMLRDKHKGDWK